MTDMGSFAAAAPEETRRRPLFVTVLAFLLALGSAAILAGGILRGLGAMASATAAAAEAAPDRLQILLAAVLVAGLGLVLARSIWLLRNWARAAIILLLGVVGLYFGLTELLRASGQIFGGEQVVPLIDIARIALVALGRVALFGALPAAILYGLIRTESTFQESAGQRQFVDRSVRYLLIATALSATFIVFLIILFTLSEAWDSITQIGLGNMLLGTIWRPGSIIGTDQGQFGLVPMMAGSVLATFGAIVLGVPLSVGTAILLAEVAPQAVREIVRPAVELLAGIPSVVYGLFGMVVLAPLIRTIEVPYNTGFGLFNASIILAVMLIPTVTNIAEDAIRAVPREYKEGSLALGTTHWQTIVHVILPAARSGIVAAVILGIGRALGETMAMIMVIGNSIAIPEPLTGNPLSIFLSSARTLTGNIAVEINYAAGPHRSALFFTGVLLFLMILLVNTLARFFMRERLAS
jgi:phosphate transport system permease protein